MRWHVLITVLLLAANAGCPQLGAVHYFLQPDPTVEAEFTLPKGPLMILVDDQRGLVEPPVACHRLVDALSKQIREHAGLERVTGSEEINRLRQSEPKFEQMSIREAGRLTQADTMIWLYVLDFGFDQNLEVAISPGRFIVRLKVFNLKAENKENLRIWPPQPDGRVVDVTLKSYEIRACKSKAEVHEKLAEALADKIAKLFYKYTVEK